MVGDCVEESGGLDIVSAGSKESRDDVGEDESLELSLPRTVDSGGDDVLVLLRELRVELECDRSGRHLE